MTTIRDVAREAGVSVATVSRVLNNPQSVRKSTRARVEEVIQELRYYPDPTARSLSTGRSYTIGVFLPFLTRPSYVQRLHGIEAALSHSGYELVVSNSESMAKRDAYYDRLIRERRRDGTVIMSLRPRDSEARALVACEVPVVLVDCSHPLLPSVDVDDVEGGRMAARHLLAQGHQRFAFLGEEEVDFDFLTARERLQGFAEVLAEAGIALPEENRFWIPHSRREARALVDELLVRPSHLRPTALFATADTVALGVLDGLRQQALRAPDDLAVLGFDDLDVAELYDLSSIRQPLFQSGVRGVESVLTLLETTDRPTLHLQLPLTLVRRGTT